MQKVAKISCCNILVSEVSQYAKENQKQQQSRHRSPACRDFSVWHISLGESRMDPWPGQSALIFDLQKTPCPLQGCKCIWFLQVPHSVLRTLHLSHNHCHTRITAFGSSFSIPCVKKHRARCKSVSPVWSALCTVKSKRSRHTRQSERSQRSFIKS